MLSAFLAFTKQTFTLKLLSVAWSACPLNHCTVNKNVKISDQNLALWECPYADIKPLKVHFGVQPYNQQ